MINIKNLILFILFLLPISISSFYNKTTFFKYQNNTIIVKITDKNLSLDLEDYIIGVVGGEMPALFQEEALKAQAIASRSYAMSKINNNEIIITSSINDQVYLTNYELKSHWEDKYNEYLDKIAQCVNNTNRLVVTRDNKILKTYYFSMSNGYTENSETVFNDTSFTSVESVYDNADLPNYEVSKTYPKTKLMTIFNSSQVKIGNIVRNDTHHVESIIINDKTYSGVEFRNLLKLRSTDFEITENDENYIITTRGYGHDVGMSQYGSNGMAKNGYKYDEIINHYYKDTKISKI